MARWRISFHESGTSRSMQTCAGRGKPAIDCRHVCRRTVALEERHFADQLSPDAVIFDGLEHLRLEAR